MIVLFIYYSVRIDGRRGQKPRRMSIHRSDGIKRDLMAGTTIVVDRYVYSGVAFTAAKVGPLIRRG